MWSLAYPCDIYDADEKGYEHNEKHETLTTMFLLFEKGFEFISDSSDDTFQTAHLTFM